MADAPLPGGKYEFAEHHEDDFSHLARYMRIAATFMLVLGGLTALGGVLILVGSAVSGASGMKGFNGIRALISGSVWLTLGGIVMQSSFGFRSIVDSKGRDIKHLMEAVRQLATAFMLMAIGFCVQLILVGIGLALRTPH